MNPSQQAVGTFRTTRWSMVAEARAVDGPQSSEALSRLCGIYWKPVYHFIRHRGHSPHDAEDFTQGFFQALIEKNYLRSVQRERGKFRSFLMAAAKHYLLDQYDRQRAQKRGGHVEKFSLDTEASELALSADLKTATAPEEAFDRAWAGTVLDRSLLRLERLYQSRGKMDRFQVLRPCLVGESERGYASIAEELRVSEGVVKTEVKRMRQSFRRILRDEVSETLTDPSELEAELRYLGSLIQ